MKQLVIVVLTLFIGGNILKNAEEYNRSNPLKYTQTVYAEEPEAPKEVLIATKVDWTPERINQEIEKKAKEYGVSDRIMKAVIKCESNGSTTIQSYHKKNGKREESYGLVQIHLPSHPNITHEQAIDPAFAIDFMANQFAQGNANLWSCYRML